MQNKISSIMLEVAQLDPDEQIELLVQIAGVLRRSAYTVNESKYTLLDLDGLGKELWATMDTDAYLNKLRNEW